jgi:hypothetical protein
VLVVLMIPCSTAVTVAAAGRPRPVVQLTMTVYPRGHAHPGAQRYGLTCRPDSGNVPHVVRACRRLLALSHPFAPVPPGTICSHIALGPQTALVVGRVGAQRIWARLRLAGSCEIARWRRLAAVVPGFPAPARG